MEEEYIDVNNAKMQHERALARLIKDPNVSSTNKEILQRFLRDAALGKTLIGRAKKKVGPSRLAGYIYQLFPLILFLQKNLDQVTQGDMERFIEALETNEIKSRGNHVFGQPDANGARSFGDRYKVDIKMTVKKFYKWLWGRNKTYPELVEWIDTYQQPKETVALSEAEVGMLINRCKTTLQRVLIQILFDGGFRLGELLNVRLYHVQLKSFDERDPSRKCFFVRIPFSKTTRRTVALPMHATSKLLDRWLEDHRANPVLRPDGTIDANDVAMQLFPMTANAVRLIVHRAGKIALNKRVYPHLLRHTSATYWSNKMPYFKFCKRFGWTMTSSMPQRYIDREGVDEMEVAASYHDKERTKLANEKEGLLAELAELKTRLQEIDQGAPQDFSVAMHAARGGVSITKK